MKRIWTIFSIILIACTAFTFTSCDKDADEADALLGIWQGSIYTRTGDFDTEIHFEEGGYGAQQDYDGYTYYTSDFTWYVQNGVIYIHYSNHYDFEDVAIYDYSFENGYLDGLLNNDKEIHIKKVVNWSNWHAKKSIATDQAKKALSDSTSTKK